MICVGYQGDQIWLFRLLSDCLLLGSLLKISEGAQIFGLHFCAEKASYDFFNFGRFFSQTLRVTLWDTSPKILRQ
jgi:hypothetical protein